MESKVKIAVGLAILAIFLPVIYFFASIPRDDISSLEKGYVETKVTKEGPEYSFVSKRPKNWKTFNQISKHVRHAIVISEDWAFFQHEGVDTEQIKKAIEDHLNKGEKLRGASTISQQLVKNLFLSNERSFVRKAKEYFITKYMESKLSKKKILEVYLNIIQYGKGLYGIQMAARHYFKKDASELTPREAAFLAMLLPNPVKYAQSYKDKMLTAYADKTINSILKKMHQAHYLNEDEYNQALDDRLSWSRGIRGKDGKIKELNIRGRASSSLSDGSEYERMYQNDSDLSVKELKYDDDAMVQDLSGAEAEFNIDEE